MPTRAPRGANTPSAKPPSAKAPAGARRRTPRNLAPRGGIDLGGTKIEAIVVDSENTVLASARRPTPTAGGPSDVGAAMVEAIRQACKAAAVEPSALQGVGVGSPGVIDDDGAVSSARNLPGWDGKFELGAA